MSIVSALIDNGLYVLLNWFFLTFFSGLSSVFLCTAGARIVSSLFNFFMNKKVVFKTQLSTGKALMRYYALALPQLVVQALLTQGVYTFFHISPYATTERMLIYAVVMGVLYIVSFVIQQRWVFASQNKAQEVSVK